MPISKIDQVDNIRVGSLLAQVAGGSNQAIAQALNLATQRGMQAERLFADQQTQFLKERSDLREFEEDQRQFGLNFDEKKRQFGLNFGEGQRQFNTQQGLREREFGERQAQNDISNSIRSQELDLSRVRQNQSAEEFKFRVGERDRRLAEAQSGATGATSTSSGATRKASESEEFQAAVTGKTTTTPTSTVATPVTQPDPDTVIAQADQAKALGDEETKAQANADKIAAQQQKSLDAEIGSPEVDSGEVRPDVIFQPTVEAPEIGEFIGVAQNLEGLGTDAGVDTKNLTAKINNVLVNDFQGMLETNLLLDGGRLGESPSITPRDRDTAKNVAVRIARMRNQVQENIGRKAGGSSISRSENKKVVERLAKDLEKQILEFKRQKIEDQKLIQKQLDDVLKRTKVKERNLKDQIRQAGGLPDESRQAFDPDPNNDGGSLARFLSN